MKYYLGLGSNLGDSQEIIRKALSLIEKRGLGEIIACSSLYLTEPVDMDSGGWFLNAVCAVESNLAPEKMMQELLAIEKELGRKRIKGKKNLPRTIDIDILIVDDIIYKSDTVIIPHPKIKERRFVLEPLSEIAPELVEPISKKTISELLANLTNNKKVIKLNEKF